MHRMSQVLLLQAGCAWGMGLSPAAILGLGGLSMLTKNIAAAAVEVPRLLRGIAVLSVLTGAWVLLNFVATGGAVISGQALLYGVACLVLPVMLQA